jgi:hypothetical protein
VAILARDAETGKAIPGAEVHVSYPLEQPHFGPSVSSSTTRNDGVARIWSAPYSDDGMLMQVSALGYMAEEKVAPLKAVEAIEPAHLFEQVEQRPVNFVVDLYAEPRPKIELIVPNGFRGIIRAEERIDDRALCPPGKRVFSYRVSNTGEVRLEGPAMLRRAVFADADARYEDGTPLSSSAKLTDLGFWWLRADSGYQLFVVNTRIEYDSLCRSSQVNSEGTSRSSGGKGGGRGRRNHGSGDPGSSGPNP